MSTQNDQAVKTKSEILFVYDSIYSIPNGDPFTGEQRYDEETKKTLVSDVRIKRFIRDYFLDANDYLPEDRRFEVYVWNDLSQTNGKGSGSAARMRALKAKYKGVTAIELLSKCIDVRLFGGISTEEKDAVNLTGPVQFSLLNSSLNDVDLRMHQNTSVFVSSVEKSRGAIGTTTVVPYCVSQVHGWINPFSAKKTGLTDSDVQYMFRALWDSINNANTRTKSNQNSLLLLEIVYADPAAKLYGLDRLIKLDIANGKRSESIRGLSDFTFNFTGLTEAVRSDVVSKVNYHCEQDRVSKPLYEAFEHAGMKDKLEALQLPRIINYGEEI